MSLAECVKLASRPLQFDEWALTTLAMEWSPYRWMVWLIRFAILKMIGADGFSTPVEETTSEQSLISGSIDDQIKHKCSFARGIESRMVFCGV